MFNIERKSGVFKAITDVNSNIKEAHKTESYQMLSLITFVLSVKEHLIDKRYDVLTIFNRVNDMSDVINKCEQSFSSLFHRKKNGILSNAQNDKIANVVGSV
jgi:23S rRNA U2552 (ribose-2'-O)-methylase RlmE/FtsJ